MPSVEKQRLTPGGPALESGRGEPFAAGRRSPATGSSPSSPPAAWATSTAPTIERLDRDVALKVLPAGA